MRSQVRFFMDADDERAFVDEVVRDLATVLVEGPRWEIRKPLLLNPKRLPARAGYVVIWNPADVPRLKTRRYPDGHGFEIANEPETIQFLRCCICDGTVLTEGRIAVACPDGHPVERRYKALRKWIRGTFRNRVVCWTDAERTVRSPPDATVWVSPGALAWLASDERRQFKQGRFYRSEAVLCDAAAGQG